jgi:hypothetical protein
VDVLRGDAPSGLAAVLAAVSDSPALEVMPDAATPIALGSLADGGGTDELYQIRYRNQRSALTQ